MPQRRNNKKLLLISLLFCLAVLGLAAANRRDIYDWWALRGYQAPSTVAQLAMQDTMTPYARKILYVNHPAIDSKAAFSIKCPNNGGEQTIVLGCYHSDQAGIFLLNVSDPRLNGVEQVTEAHEMLHAAYDRLSTAERNKVDAMLLDYYDHNLHDQRIITTMAAYKKTEPHDVVNEMHSVFGTEIANLPAGLEQYYKQYFTNRSQIAAYAAQYQAEFTSRQATVAADDSQLSGLKSHIDSDEADLKTKQSQINSQQSQLVAERSSNPAAYNAAVPAYNAQIDAYNGEVQTVQSLIDQYNQLVAARNIVAGEEDQLVNDLNGSPATLSRSWWAAPEKSSARWWRSVTSRSPSAVASTSDQGHLQALRAGLSDVAHHPIGFGPGTAGPASYYNTGHPTRIAENYFVQIGQETGWLGLVLFILINVGVGMLLYVRRADPLALSLFASLIGLTFINLFSHAWADDTLAYVWWGLAGVALAPLPNSKAEPDETDD